MDFSTLSSLWNDCNRPDDISRYYPEFHHYLRDPVERGWLTLCVNWLRARDRTCIPLPTREITNSWFQDDHTRNVASCYISVLRLIERGLDKINTESELLNIATTHLMQPGQVLNIYDELIANKSDEYRPWTLKWPRYSKYQTAPYDSVSGRVVLVSGTIGIVAQLTLDCVPNNSQPAVLWRAPALLLLEVSQDDRWNEAERTALSFLKQQDLLLTGYDFRYRIDLPPGAKWPLILTGDSWYGQLQLLLLRAVARREPKKVRKLFPRITHIDFRRVAICACALDRDRNLGFPGQFHSVSSFFRKLGAVIKESRPYQPIITIVVAKDQYFDTLAYRRSRATLPIWYEPITSLPIVKADSVSVALDFLWAQQRPRRVIQQVRFAGMVLCLVTGAVFWFRPPKLLDIRELASDIQNEEAQVPGTNSINTAVARWASGYDLTRSRALAQVRKLAEADYAIIWDAVTSPRGSKALVSARTKSTEVNPESLERAIYLRDKLEQISPSGKVRTNEWIVEATSTPMVYIPPGQFLMGSDKSDPKADANQVPQIMINVERPFWIGKYEVTQREYNAIIEGGNPSFFNGVKHSTKYNRNVDYGALLDRPVESVAYSFAGEFCSQLTDIERSRINRRMGTNYVFRLPTEREWEYACRATTTNIFSFGSDNSEQLKTHAWTATVGTHAVGLKFPNLAGLYDMHGNVSEMCIEVQNGDGAVRGGSAAEPTIALRSAYRFGFPKQKPANYIGFRIVLGPRVPGTPTPVRPLK